MLPQKILVGERMGCINAKENRKAGLALARALLLRSQLRANPQPDPAAMISDFRMQHREGRVTSDPTLKRIAQNQANAMASKGVMDHDVFGSFSSRMSPANAGHAAENIAYGYDSFQKTLDQWINSPGHRKNLLLQNASRVGVASARGATDGRTYWAMVIAGGYEKPKPAGAKSASPAGKQKVQTPQACRIRLLGICL